MSCQDSDDDLSLPGNTGNKDKVAVLAIAYHNMGVEQEFLRSYPAAILSYKKAVNFAEKNLGPEDGITLNLRSVYENAKNEVSIYNMSVNIDLYVYSLTWLCLKKERRVLKEEARRRRWEANNNTWIKTTTR